MALETVVYQQDLLSHSGSTSKEFFNLFQGGSWSFEEEEEEEDEDKKGGIFVSNELLACQNEALFPDDNKNYNTNSSNWNSSLFSPPYNSLLVPHFDQLIFNETNSNQEYNLNPDNGLVLPTPPASDYNLPHQMLETWPSVDGVGGGAKRRRPRSRKNMEERENQRMTHIAVERNRRKQMNQYLSALRSLMPESYVPRVDQASIVGGAINFVKELEQRLQLLSTTLKGVNNKENPNVIDPVSSPFSEFFTFPQYSMVLSDQTMGENSAFVADIEVTMVESHASLKIRSRRRPKQLLKIVSGLQFLRLSILHLNVTTKEQFVFYSLSVKVEDDCKFTSVDDIATAVHQMLGKIQEESLLK